MNLISTPDTQAEFVDAVLKIIASARAHIRSGNLDGEESVSHVRDELSYKGWRRLGSPGDFEDTLIAAGFSIRSTNVGNGTRRAFVGV